MWIRDSQPLVSGDCFNQISLLMHGLCTSQIKWLPNQIELCFFVNLYQLANILLFSVNGKACDGHEAVIAKQWKSWYHLIKRTVGISFFLSSWNLLSPNNNQWLIWLLMVLIYISWCSKAKYGMIKKKALAISKISIEIYMALRLVRMSLYMLHICLEKKCISFEKCDS